MNKIIIYNYSRNENTNETVNYEIISYHILR